MTNNLTTGNETRVMLRFSIPFIIGNLLQQIYNIADTFIVGHFLGSNALAAVGSAYAFIVLFTSIILGLCIGSGIVFSQLFGEKNIGQLKTAIWNGLVFVFAVTCLIFCVSFFLLDQFLLLLQVPESIFEDTKLYIQIILYGLFFTFLYNFGAAIIRSIGNSLIPLLFLVIASVINIVLDIVLIVAFHMGVAGAAIATVIAQTVSAILIVGYYQMKIPMLRLKRENLRLDRELLKRVASNSVLNSIQQSIMNFGILMVQGLVNSFGVSAMAAFAAGVKIDAFAYMPVQDFGNAFSTYIAQNYGARKMGRIKTGIRQAMKLSLSFSAVVSLLIFLFAEQLMGIFVREEEIIQIGASYLRIEGVFYMGIGLLFLLYGLYRGLGKAQMSIVLTVISLGSRVLLAYVLAPIPRIGLSGIWWAIPIGWILADLTGLLYWKRCQKAWKNLNE
ncbi:MATE family efflux transporter [Massiliimalia massiliensis]|uniref:MATE family efflux transporter n=1 Tax=Massiliimalia massiliensis TaxID=1852384 RepID=UPI001179E507|nr:MATE family efflux transporter [Massiliimalia massiliensis]